MLLSTLFVLCSLKTITRCYSELCRDISSLDSLWACGARARTIKSVRNVLDRIGAGIQYFFKVYAGIFLVDGDTYRVHMYVPLRYGTYITHNESSVLFLSLVVIL